MTQAAVTVTTETTNPQGPPPPRIIQNDGLLPHAAATIRLLDKMTARVEQQDVSLDTPILFGKMQVVVRACRAAPAEDNPQSAAYFDIRGFEPGQTGTPIFTGWMFAATTAISAMEHPVYDVWLVGCKGPLSAPASVNSTGDNETNPHIGLDATLSSLKTDERNKTSDDALPQTENSEKENEKENLDTPEPTPSDTPTSEPPTSDTQQPSVETYIQ